MKPELPSTETGEVTALHSREVEYALILSQMISVAEEDPSQMRLAIYEFARTKLNSNAAFALEAERKQLSAALEAAILGVEKFSAARDAHKRPQLQRISSIPDESSPSGPHPPQMLEYGGSGTADHRPPDADTSDQPKQILSKNAPGKWIQIFRRNWFAIGLSLAVVLAGATLLASRKSLWRSESKLPAAPLGEVAKQTHPVAAPAPQPIVPSFPMPSDYGVYAFNGGSALVELQALSEQVPDTRVAMSTPISQPSRTTLPAGNIKFVIFRRDFAGTATDRFEVRTVARIKRIVTFDQKGKPAYAAAPANWIIRNIAYEFKVRPAPGHAEMLLVQPKDPDLELPPGRYVLALKDQGYDFSIAGSIDDPSHCLERTDAANGSFYSACQAE